MNIAKFIIPLLACTALFGCRNEQSSKVETWELNNWMSAVDDTVRVCKMSIPGSHDALTGCGFTDDKYIDDYTTQVATLDEQLEGGIRYFDVRLVLNEGSGKTILQASHRTATINLTFTDVLDKVKEFFTNHPSEFVIVKIQYDGGDMNEDIQVKWSETLKSVINAEAYRTCFVDFRPDLRVRDLRGKILLLSRTAYGEPVSGALTNWTDEGSAGHIHFDSLAERTLVLAPTPDASEAFQGGDHPLSARLYVQDYYNSMGSRIDEKLRAVEAMYHSAMQVCPDENVWIINHTSGFSSPKMNAIGYAENASRTNAKLLSLLQADTTSTTCLGIIAMDYACLDTLNQSIGTLGVITRTVLSKSLTRAVIVRNKK